MDNPQYSVFTDNYLSSHAKFSFKPYYKWITLNTYDVE